MAGKLRWGIIGPGKISRKFAKGLAAVEGAELVAVGSRAKERADRFADEFAGEFDVPNRHGSYEALAADPDVDAVYI
ncbi:MAG: Gfo/Idh/MocA family oxidoreductase, partial [Planctomycetota bacterium]